MKALHFAKPLEFRVESPADSLTQGETFSGTFQAINRGGEPLEGITLSVALAYAEFKPLKAEGDSAFDVRERQTLAEGHTLAPGETFRADWSFELPLDAPITSKTGGLFLLYGGGPADEAVFGRLDLPVGLTPLLETFLGTLESQFSFVESSRKHSKGFTEVALKAPNVYPTLDKVTLRLRQSETATELVWDAKVKGFSKGKGGVASKSRTKEQSLELSQMLMGGKHPNRAFFKTAIDEALGDLVPAILQS